MKPYARQNLTREERIFNYILSRTRRCVECAFGILTAKWRCLKTELHMYPENVDIVKCICLLHNIIIDKEGLTSLENVMESVPMNNMSVEDGIITMVKKPVTFEKLLKIILLAQ